LIITFWTVTESMPERNAQKREQKSKDDGLKKGVADDFLLHSQELLIFPLTDSLMKVETLNSLSPCSSGGQIKHENSGDAKR
jgi:hypothetical protein